jgi:hypothetical protein
VSGWLGAVYVLSVTVSCKWRCSSGFPGRRGAPGMSIAAPIVATRKAIRLMTCVMVQDATFFEYQARFSLRGSVNL